MRSTVLIIIAASISVSLQASDTQESGSAGATGSYPEPLLLLVRDSVVQAELGLSDSQKSAVDKVIAEVDEPLWLLRDNFGQDADTKKRQLVAKLHQGLQGVLKSDQQQRLRQLVLQANGWSSLRLPSVIKELKPTREQQKRLLQVHEETRQALQALEKQAASSKATNLADKASKIRAEEVEKLGGVLTDNQKRQFISMVGKPFDLSGVRLRAVRAPELRHVTAWINSKPLPLKELQGRVVIVHFWTFG